MNIWKNALKNNGSIMMVSSNKITKNLLITYCKLFILQEKGWV